MAESINQYTCHACQVQLVASPQTVIREFALMPGFWYVVVSCDSCHKTSWLAPLRFRQEAEAAGAKVLRYPGYPPRDILAWHEQHPRERFTVPDPPLPGSGECTVAFMAHLLETRQAHELLDWPGAA